jgi:hypothetical protein
MEVLHMKKTLTISNKTRILLFIIGGMLVAGILLVSCGGGGYGGGGGMSGSGMAAGAFALSMPGNGATGVSLTPTLVWNPSAGATSYAVQVTHGTTIVFTDTKTMTSDMVSPSLAPNTTYDWQVTATGIYGPITAGPFSFMTGTM